MKTKHSRIIDAQKDNMVAAVKGTETVAKAMVDSAASVGSSIVDATRKTVNKSNHTIKVSSRRAPKTN